MVISSVELFAPFAQKDGFFSVRDLVTLMQQQAFGGLRSTRLRFDLPGS
jgi:hypothetical protein